MTTFLELQARDPIVCRDGRPFGAGSGRRMKSQSWPSPSVTAGSLRTAIGKAAGGDFPTLIEKLKAVGIAGPFPVFEGKMYLPAPADCVVMRSGMTYPARPADGTTDLPNGLRPVCLPATDEAGGKRAFGPAWWSVERLAAWLGEEQPRSLHALSAYSPECLAAAAIDERTHVEINSATFGAVDGMLFATQGAVLDQMMQVDKPFDTTLAVRVVASSFEKELEAFDAVHPFGGERRLVHVTAKGTLNTAWRPPAVDSLKTKLKALNSCDGVRMVRMVLATPAIFMGGWKPGWLDTGNPPGCPEVKLELVGVSIERWKAVSGWSYETNGPKPIRRTVPAGGVYFFKLKSGDASNLQWLESVCDNPQDGRDGFGLATWGLWTPHKEKE